ncbi:Ig-like domain-containing protein [Ulvibacterium sp.]|uniref:Ig-like domain-containing protein n=1 Tax=Ulvibacterium sp. TaxID=2665914 RepID=UPI002627A99E|nr:Ig-like domain-containing protein [Ulvibacterium sp.]
MASFTYSQFIFIGSILFCCTLFGQNTPPVATDDVYPGYLNRNITIDALNGVLTNDTDPDGGSLTVNPTPVVSPVNGILTLGNDGSFTFVPQAGFVGNVNFDYEVCDDGTANELVSQFDFDTSTLTAATVGPDATSINSNAVQTACGVRIGSGAGGSTGLDITIPNTGSIFDFTSFRIEFDYQDNEGTADIITGGNFRIYHITSNELGVSITVINGSTGLSTSYTRTLGSFLSGNVTYIVEYDELTGDITYTANGTTTTISNVAPDYSPLDTSLVTAPIVGRFMDNSGGPDPSLCKIAITDTSKLCDIGTVNINITTSLITNKRITYRVNPD